MNAIHRTGQGTFPAFDTLRRNRNLLGFQIYRTNLLTFSACNTLLLFPVHLYQRKAVKPAINCTKWTKILTKRPVNLYRHYRQKHQNRQLPSEQSACQYAKIFICRHQRKSSHQSPRRTDIFTKRRSFNKSAKQNQ